MSSETRWEYRQVDSPETMTCEELNRLGADGWELAESRDLISGYTYGGPLDNVKSFGRYTFKRPIKILPLTPVVADQQSGDERNFVLPPPDSSREIPTTRREFEDGTSVLVCPHGQVVCERCGPLVHWEIPRRRRSDAVDARRAT